MTPGLCACYKCVVSGRWWNLTVVDIIRDRPLVRSCGDVSTLRELFSDQPHECNLPDSRTETDNTLVALYFGAIICEASRAFANELWDAQCSLSATGRRLEVVYVTADRNAQQVFDFMKSHPHWHALRFEDPAIEELRSFLCVRSTPALIIIDNVGLISRFGRRDLRTLGPQAAWRQWINAKLILSQPVRASILSEFHTSPLLSTIVTSPTGPIAPPEKNI